MSSSTDTLGGQYVEGSLLDTATLRRFARPNPWRWLLGAAQEWTVIGLTLWACNQWPHWWLWIPAIFVIGTRQHGLGILAHEGVHFLVSRNRFWNDFLANALASYPITYPVSGYRTMHLKHHRLLDTAEDPERASIDYYPKEWSFPISKRYWYWLLARDLSGVYQKPLFDLSHYIWHVPGGNLPHILGIACYHGAIIALAVKTGYLWTYLLLWILPLVTVALMCFRIRTAAEHSGIYAGERRYHRETVDTLATTRTVTGCPLVRFLFAPHNMSYHIEHHLYPVVPVFRLKALHEVLLDDPRFKSKAHVTEGYQNLVDELTAT